MSRSWGPSKLSHDQGSSPRRRQQSGRPESGISQVEEELGAPGAWGWCVRAAVLAARPPFPPLSPAAAAGCNLSSVLGKPSRDLLSRSCLLLFARPFPAPSGAAAPAPESECWRAHPDLSYRAGDPAYVRHQLIRLPRARGSRRQRWRCPRCCPRPSALGLVLSMVLSLLPEMSSPGGTSLPKNFP